MPWIARPRLEARLEESLAAPRPALTLVRGEAGSGKSGLLRTVLSRRAADGARIVAVGGTPGPAHRHRRTLVTDLALGAAGFEGRPSGGSPPRAGPVGEPLGGGRARSPLAGGWAMVVEGLLSRLEATREPLVFVLDDLPGLAEADDGLAPALGRLWSGARARGLPLHLIAADRHDDVVDAMVAESGPWDGVDADEIRVGPVSWTDLRRHFADWAPADRRSLHACLGRSPATLGRVDPEVRLSTNLQRLVLDPAGALHGRPALRLAVDVQKVERYAGILATVAEGAREWREIAAGDPAFASGNRLAPYLATLQERGWVEAHRSLDAAPRSRRTRYALVDPFVGFWYAAVQPVLGRLLAGASVRALWRGPVRAAAREHARRRLASACRSVLLERGDEVLPVGPRLTGGLWGEGYELPVSGTLRNGGALYGLCVDGRRATVGDADHVTAQMRATRYGFGRQARLRAIFTTRGGTEPLVRRAARDELLTLVPTERLF